MAWVSAVVDLAEMDGLELIRHLAERDGDVAVIIVSGLDERLLLAAESIASAYGVNVLGAMRKPLSVVGLGKVLGRREP